MKLYKWKACIGLCVFLLTLGILHLPGSVHAASLRVTASASTVYVGDSVTFTVSASGGAGNITVSGAASGSYWLDNSSESFTVTASSVGTLTLSASGTLADYDTEKDMSVSSSASVQVIARPTKTPSNNSSSSNQSSQSQSSQQEPVEEIELSSNANLKSLSVSQGTLSPNFSASKTQYTLNLDGDITSLKVTATADDSNASVYGTGTKSLKPGKNTVTVSVEAEDGSTKEYIITVNVDETPLVYLPYNGANLGVVRNLDGVDKPAKFFESETITIDGKEVNAWKSTTLNKTVLYLQDDTTKEKNYYIYNTETNTVETIFRPMVLLGNQVFIVDVPENLQKRDGMTFTKVTIDKVELDGWTFNDEALENYALIYVMDEKGNMVYYQYEATQKTLQLYSGAAAITQEAYAQYQKDAQAALEKQKILTYVLGGCCVALTALCIFLLLHRRKTVKYQKRNIASAKRDMEADILRNLSEDE